MSRRRLLILGSTGSIGTQSLQVAEAFREEFDVVGLAAGGRARDLAEQVERWRPQGVALANPETPGASDLRKRCHQLGIPLFVGEQASVELICHVSADVIVVAVVGVCGIEPTLAAVQTGATVALANKESIVCAGELVMNDVRRHGTKLLPLDSEHSAIFQCLEGNGTKCLRRLIVTASGGPFRKTPLGELAGMSRADALAHPTWRMGEKITIDSATMMNKGFEVIEAHWLFDVPLSAIDVVIHPQSCIHSMVEFVDGSILAQLGPTDMRLPIQHCLFHPDRRPGPLPPLDFASLGRLEFEPVDTTRYPCLELARESLMKGGTYPAVLAAANDIAVAEFLAERIDFGAISKVVSDVLHQHAGDGQPISLPSLRQAMTWAQETARSHCRQRQTRSLTCPSTLPTT